MTKYVKLRVELNLGYDSEIKIIYFCNNNKYEIFGIMYVCKYLKPM